MGDIKFTEEQYKAMVGATISELNDIMNVSLKQRATDLVKTAIGRAVRVEEPIRYNYSLSRRMPSMN